MLYYFQIELAFGHCKSRVKCYKFRLFESGYGALRFLIAQYKVELTQLLGRREKGG